MVHYEIDGLLQIYVYSWIATISALVSQNVRTCTLFHHGIINEDLHCSIAKGDPSLCRKNLGKFSAGSPTPYFHD